MHDFHLHLARLPQPEQLARLLAGQNYGYVAIACEPWEWTKVRDLNRVRVNSAENNRAERNRAAFGLHPMIASNVTEADFAKLREILESDPDAQVGEAGLDKRYPGYEDGSIQEQVFVRQIKLALELGRDLQIHCVGDYGRVVALLKKNGFGKSHGTAPSTSLSTSLSTSRPIFHRFGGDAGIVRAALPLGALFSLHNDSFRKKSTVAAIPLIPADSVRFETDADETYCKACAVPTSAVPAKEIAEALIRDLGDVQRLYELAIKDA